jgi:hypothetical protein
MAFPVPLVPNYVYVVIPLKMAEIDNCLVSTTLLCYVDETNDVFLIGGLFQSDETLTPAANSTLSPSG